MNIIGINGYAGTGKDTSADILVAEFDFIKRSFATPLYEEVASAFNVTVEFLGNRNTKESPIPEMALKNCMDKDFVKLMQFERMNLREENILSMERSPRFIMQQWGTEYRRIYSGNEMYWIDKMQQFIDQSGIKNLVVPDVRVEAEAAFIRQNAGHIWFMDKKSVHKVLSHSSENLLEIGLTDIIIDNNQDKTYLRNNVIEALNAVGIYQDGDQRHQLKSPKI